MSADLYRNHRRLAGSATMRWTAELRISGFYTEDCLNLQVDFKAGRMARLFLCITRQCNVRLRLEGSHLFALLKRLLLLCPCEIIFQKLNNRVDSKSLFACLSGLIPHFHFVVGSADIIICEIIVWFDPQCLLACSDGISESSGIMILQADIQVTLGGRIRLSGVFLFCG